MEIFESNDSKFHTEESSEYERIVKLLQSTRVDAAELIFEELKKSIIKRKGKWNHEDRVWPHQNGKSEKKEHSKKKLKIVDNQELYTRFVPAVNHSDENKPINETKKDEDILDLTKDEDDKVENKRLIIPHRSETKKEEIHSKRIKTDNVKVKEEINPKVDKVKSKEENISKSDKVVANSLMEDDVELLLSLSNGDQEGAEPKVLRKRKEVKKEQPPLHRISNGGVNKRRSASANQAPANLSGKGGEPLFNLKENMRHHDQDVDAGKIRQKMFYGSTQVTRRDKPRREGTLADDSKKRLEAKLKKVKAKLKKSI